MSRTIDYLDAFARFKQKENVEAVERLLSTHKELTNFERAQIGAWTASSLFSLLAAGLTPFSLYMRLIFPSRAGSLVCETAEEAKYLIPSITKKISDEDLQDLLDEMGKLVG